MNTHFLNEKGMASSLWHIYINQWFTGAAGTPIPETQVSWLCANCATPLSLTPRASSHSS